MVPLDLIFGPVWCFFDGFPTLEQPMPIKKIKRNNIENIFGIKQSLY